MHTHWRLRVSKEGYLPTGLLLSSISSLKTHVNHSSIINTITARISLKVRSQSNHVAPYSAIHECPGVDRHCLPRPARGLQGRPRFQEDRRKPPSPSSHRSGLSKRQARLFDVSLRLEQHPKWCPRVGQRDQV